MHIQSIMKPDNKTLRISEAFYSVQGEGVTTGIPSYFIRLTACNLLCGGYGTQRSGLLEDGATWRCDTLDVWIKGELFTHQQLVDHLGGELFVENVRKGAHVVFTGGEPLMQQEAIQDFIDWYHNEYGGIPFYEVETNGTIPPIEYLLDKVRQWNVSPKLSNSGMPKSKRIVPVALKTFEEDARFDVMYKFVVSGETDWAEIFVDYLPHVSRHKVVLMPAAENQVQLQRSSLIVAEIAKREVVRMCSRMHITIWNQLTGV